MGRRAVWFACLGRSLGKSQDGLDKGLYFRECCRLKLRVSVHPGSFSLRCAEVVFSIWVMCTLYCKLALFLIVAHFRNSLFCLSHALRNVYLGFNNLTVKDQIPCFVKAYLIKACILMFFYDAPKIWLSRICESNPPPPVSPKAAVQSARHLQCLVACLDTQIDLTFGSPMKSSLSTVGR